MPSTASQIDIYNMALDLLQEAPLTSLTQDKDQADWLNRNYKPARDAELRAHPWNFALDRAEIAEDATAPAFEWDHRYLMPTDVLAIRNLTVNGKLNGAPIEYEVEGSYILTDQDSPLKLRYVKRIENEGYFDPLFVEALVAKLAYKMSHWMTGKQSFSERIREDYREAILRARAADAIETIHADVYSDDVIAIRV